MDSRWCKQESCFARATQCGSLSKTTTVSLMANEFNVRSILHGQVSLAAVNQSYVFHEAMKDFKNLACYENVNIVCLTSNCIKSHDQYH